MPLQFACSHCNKLLKVADQHAGKQARCPNCQNVVQVPLSSPDQPSTDFSTTTPTDRYESPNPFADVNAPDVSQPYSANPYNAPPGEYYKSAKTPLGKGVPRQVDIGEIFSMAWKCWSNNLGLLVGTTLIVSVINGGLGFINELITQFFDAAIGGDVVVAALAIFVSQVFTSLLQIFLTIGQFKIYIEIARTGGSSFEKLFSGGDRFLSILGFNLLIGIVFGVLALLSFLPGLVLMPMDNAVGMMAMFGGITIFGCGILLLTWRMWGSYFHVLDRQSTVFDSFRDSYQWGKLNMLTTFLLWLISLGLVLAGFLAFCVGLLFAIPLASMLWVVAYLKMSGQIS